MKTALDVFVITGLTLGVALFCTKMGWMTAGPPTLGDVIWMSSSFVLGWVCHKNMSKWTTEQLKGSVDPNPLNWPGRW